MAIDTVATFTEQALGHECAQAFLVLGCVFCGWCASGVMIRLMSGASDKTSKGSSGFRREVGAFATKYSVEEAAAHSGLEATEVLMCQSEVQFWWCIETVSSWLWGTPKQPDQKPDELEETEEEEEEEMEEFWHVSIDTKCSTNPGLALLEHYGVFGAQNGAWSGSEPEEELEETEEDFWPVSVDTKCSSHPGLALLENYGVFGAQNGAWARPLH